MTGPILTTLLTVLMLVLWFTSHGGDRIKMLVGVLWGMAVSALLADPVLSALGTILGGISSAF